MDTEEAVSVYDMQKEHVSRSVSVTNNNEVQGGSCVLRQSLSPRVL